MHLRQVQIEKRDIRPRFQDQAERGGAIRAVRHYLKISTVGAESGERFPKERKRFRDEETNIGSGFHKPAASL